MRGWAKGGLPSDRDFILLGVSLSMGLLLGGWVAVRLFPPPAPASVTEVVATPVPTLVATERPQLKSVDQAPLVTRRLPTLKIPQLNVEAQLAPVGLAADGSMGVPTDGATVAWYSLGPFPGGPGNAVLAGHVDWGQRAAVFWGLGGLQSGAQIELDFQGGPLEYRVAWVEQYRAVTAPLLRVFDASTGSALTLITCGGIFDQATRQYQDRVVVRAVRV